MPEPTPLSEARTQAIFMRWTHRRDVRAILPGLAWMFHTPNGGKRSALVAAQLTAMGVKPGVPDIICPVRSRYYPGLAFEFKTARGQLTDKQAEWLLHFEGQGWLTGTVRSAQEAIELTARYFDVHLDVLPPL